MHPNISMMADKLRWRSPRKALTALGLFSVNLYALGCLSLWVGQSRFVFFPQKEIATTPERYNLKYQDVYLPVTTSNGKSERMHGWWMPSNAQSTDADKVLLYLHGNSGNIEDNLKHASRFHRLGFSVLLVDYRGYGRSEGGFPSETQVYTDAQALWDYLVRQRGIKPKRIVIYGHSLGGAIAIDLAAKHPEAAGLIVESSFTSVRDMVRRDPKFSIFPVDLLLNQRFDSINKVRSLKLPVLFIHGTADRLIPFTMSQQLFAAAPVPKQLVLIPKGGHSNNASVNERLYLQSVETFVRQFQHPAPAR